MSLHTEIGKEYLPINISSENRFTSYYQSNVLIPNLGPLLYSKLYNKAKKVLEDMDNTLTGVIHKGKHYHKKTGRRPHIPDVILDIKNETHTQPIDNSHFSPHIGVVPNLSLHTVHARATRPKKESLELLMTFHDKKDEIETIKQNSHISDDTVVSYGEMLHAMSQKSPVLIALAKDNLILSSNELVSDKLLKMDDSKSVELMVASMLKHSTPISSVHIPAFKYSNILTNTIIKNNHFSSSFIKNIKKVTPLIDTILHHFYEVYHIENMKDHLKVVESCEWAFLRQERIELTMKQPQIRGPINVLSIAPNSELTIKESEEYVHATSSSTFLGKDEQSKQYNSIESELKSKLGTLFDYGSNLGDTLSEVGYSKDSMTSEKRSRVEASLQSISLQNRSKKSFYSSSTLHSDRIYHTMGKDSNFATTEVAFEVFAPVDVKHFIDDIGVVWAPRIKNPFRGLRGALEKYEQEQYRNYIIENYVLDPSKPVPSYENSSRVTKKTAKETNPGTYYKSITFKLNSSEIKSGYEFGEDIQLSFYQESDDSRSWYENKYDEDDYWMRIVSVDRHGGDSFITIRVKYHVDDVWGNDPDVNGVTVSIDKMKKTQAYMEELRNYHDAPRINEAKRNAIKVQARKYAVLKREELMRRYEGNQQHLKDYSFSSLMKKIFRTNMGSERYSYYQGIINSCVDWDKSDMIVEPCDVSDMYETELSPYHYLNVTAIRLFLVVREGAEDIFFDSLNKSVDADMRSLFTTVHNYILAQKELLGGLKEEIDSYSKEIILGEHLESVLSKQSFIES